MHNTQLVKITPIHTGLTCGACSLPIYLHQAKEFSPSISIIIRGNAMVHTKCIKKIDNKKSKSWK